MTMDETDLKVLETLMQDARISWASLGETLGLSPPAAAERVRKLESAGIIRGFSARLDAEALGFGLTAFIAVRLDRPEQRQPFLKAVGQLDVMALLHLVEL